MESVDRVLTRLNRDFVDVLQLHWWDYDNFYYFNAVGHLMELKEEGRIREIGVSNFNAEYLGYLLEENAPIVSNQVEHFSLVFLVT
jgi:aryl-alcohol dehydrogenase-like predicted oxidoreductase